MYSYQQPPEPNLKDVLVAFSLDCLMDQPPYLYGYAADYFDQKYSEQEEAPELEEQIEEEYEIETGTEEEEMDEETEDYEKKKMSARSSSLVWEKPFNISVSHLPYYEKTSEQRRDISAARANCAMLMCLSSDQFEAMLNALVFRPISKGDVVMRQYSNGDYFYLIEKGLYDVYVANEPDEEAIKVYTYENSGCFGELSLIYNMPRAATIRAVTRGILWALDRKTFRTVVSRSIYMKRKYYEDLISNTPIFSVFDSYHKMLICDALRTKRFNPGDIIIRQGGTADGMHFIRRGRVSCTVLNKNIKADIEVTQLGVGEYFGELALITGAPRACTVLALENTMTTFMEARYFHEFMEACVPLLKERIPLYEEEMYSKTGKTLQQIYVGALHKEVQ